MFLELTLILIGVAIASLGWNWGGVADNRTSWLSIGAAGIVLGGMTLFNANSVASLSQLALAGTGAVLGLVAAGCIKWGTANDSTLGLYAFIFAAAAGLSAGGISKGHTYSILSLATTLAAVAGALIFLASLFPRVRVVRAIAGWALVVLGLAVGFLAYGPSVGVTFGGV